MFVNIRSRSSAGGIIAVAGMLALSTATLAEEKVEIHIPIAIEKLMDDVNGIKVSCYVCAEDDDCSSGPGLGWSFTNIPATDGAINGQYTFVVLPHSVGAFTNAAKYFCRFSIIRNCTDPLEECNISHSPGAGQDISYQYDPDKPFTHTVAGPLTPTGPGSAAGSLQLGD